MLLHLAEQVHPSREHFGAVEIRAEQGGGVLQVPGVDILEGFHAFPPWTRPRACRTRSGVIGSSATRTPIALNTALAIAPPVGITAGSPMPVTLLCVSNR